MSSKKGQELIGYIQKISGLNDTEVQEIFCSKELSKQKLNPDQLTTDDLRLIAAKMLESLHSKISGENSNKVPLNEDTVFSHNAVIPQA